MRSYPDTRTTVSGHAFIELSAILPAIYFVPLLQIYNCTQVLAAVYLASATEILHKIAPNLGSPTGLHIEKATFCAHSP